jgi:hypothetical protein
MKFYSLTSHGNFEGLPYLRKAICFPSAGHVEVHLVTSLEVFCTFPLLCAPVTVLSAYIQKITVVSRFFTLCSALDIATLNGRG